MFDLCALIRRILPFLSRPRPRAPAVPARSTTPNSENDPTILPRPYVKPKMVARDDVGEDRKYIGGYTAAEFLAAERAAAIKDGTGPPASEIGWTGVGEIDYDDPALKFLTEVEGIRD